MAFSTPAFCTRFLNSASLAVNESLILLCWPIAMHVQYTRTESDRLGYAKGRLTGSPIVRDLEKYTEVFTESVKC